MAVDNSWTDPPRIDLWDKVTGQTKFIEDLPDLPGTVYAATLRSPYSHARILSIDSSEAARLPGVLGILDRENMGDLKPMWKSGEQSFLTLDKARFDGDVLGMVAAVDLRTARRAVELIKVEYDLLPPVFSAEDAVAPQAVLVHEGLGSNLALAENFEWGNVDEGFKLADRTFEETYLSSSMFHYPIEPATSIIANFAGDTADLWAPTNMPFEAVEQVRRLFDIKPEQIRVRVPFVGGNFGAKLVTSHLIGLLALSKSIGHPIKLIVSAEESFRNTARHAATFKAKVGVRSDGTLVALDVDLLMDTGAYFTGADVATYNALTAAWGCYRIPHFRVAVRTVYTNKVPAGHFRSTGKTQTTFSIECAMDSVARRMGIDPLEFRKKNTLLKGERITDKWKWAGEEIVASSPPIDVDLTDMMRRAAGAIGWDGRATSKGTGTGTDSRLARGKGIAVGLRRGSQISGRTHAMATLDRNGTIRIAHNASEVGQGVTMVLSLIASRTLGVPQSQIEVGMPDTLNDLPFDGTTSQRTTVKMGNAVQAACEELKQEICAATAQAKGGTPQQWRVEGGRVMGGEASFSFAEIFKDFPGSACIKGIGVFSQTTPKDRPMGVDYWAPGATAAEVEVDRETGEIRVLQYSFVGDAGKAIHYLSAQRQVEGGAVLGFGIGLFEELFYQDGQLQNADTFQYRVPVLRDIPESFHFLLLEDGNGPGPFGSKGIAQVSITGAAPAIGNAICDAIGVHIKSTPFHPEKILRALGKLDIQ